MNPSVNDVINNEKIINKGELLCSYMWDKLTIDIIKANPDIS